MLTVEDLHTYYGRAHILQGIGLEVPVGQVVALLGRNGAGKTTTIKSIMGLVRPRQGRITLDGREITGWPPYRIARLGLGYVPEERRVFTDLTVRENLEVGRHPPRADTPAWTVDQMFDLFPNLAERAAQGGGQLSGGEQQMLTIARTLMGNPRLVLLDEPSEGIAPVIVQQMAETIRRLKRDGLTVLLSEQNLHFARAVADQVVVLEKGSVRFAGSLGDLDAHPDIRDQYLMV